jgi:hypothetical protein
MLAPFKFKRSLADKCTLGQLGATSISNCLQPAGLQRSCLEQDQMDLLLSFLKATRGCSHAGLENHHILLHYHCLQYLIILMSVHATTRGQDVHFAPQVAT